MGKGMFRSPKKGEKTPLMFYKNRYTSKLFVHQWLGYVLLWIWPDDFFSIDLFKGGVCLRSWESFAQHLKSPLMSANTFIHSAEGIWKIIILQRWKNFHVKEKMWFTGTAKQSPTTTQERWTIVVRMYYGFQKRKLHGSTCHSTVAFHFRTRK